LPNQDSSLDAIVVRNVYKQFRKRTISSQHSTLKSELLRWVLRRKPQTEVSRHIQALRGVNLTIPKGATLGLIGRNGSGKSTLLKLITGIYTPTSGTVQVNGRISALLELGAGFHPDFSGRENIFINGIILGLTRAEIKDRLEEIITFSELGDFIDEPVRTYSSGMFMRLAFSVATHVNPDILLIDEILSVGDEHFSHKSFAKMTEFKARGKTIVYVTHDLTTMQRWCDCAAWVDGGVIRAVGTPQQIVAQYLEEVARGEKQGLALEAKAPPPVPVPEPEPTPSLEPPVPASEPPPAAPLPAGPQTGPLTVTLLAVRLLNAAGQPATVVDPEDALDLSMDFTCQKPPPDVVFGMGIFREDGVRVFGTNTLIDGIALPRPLPLSGELRFHIERLGLLPGTYTVNVAVHSEAGVPYDERVGQHVFQVRSAVADAGFYRPAHRWALNAARLPQTG